MEAEKLRRQQKRMQREKLKAQEASLKKQLEVRDGHWKPLHQSALLLMSLVDLLSVLDVCERFAEIWSNSENCGTLWEKERQISLASSLYF